MRHLDLFSGIGGFALAASWVWGDEYETHAFIEFDNFCQEWLKANFPGVPIHEDAKTYKHDGTTIDLLTGGPPCQPVSIAGAMRGEKDDRWLWPTMLRIIQDVGPKTIIFENVPHLINIDGGLLFDGILSDMEDAGYEVAPPFVIPACSQNAPHRRDRVFVVAHSNKFGDVWNQSEYRAGERGEQDGKGDLAYSDGPGLEEQGGSEPIRSEHSAVECTGEAVADTEKRTVRPGLCEGEPGRERGRRSGDTRNNGQQQCAGEVEEQWRRPWDTSSWILGHDGNARRVKPGVRLLAHGFPKRNDLFRAFGNAIVPQVAVKIMEAIKAALGGVTIK